MSERIKADREIRSKIFLAATLEIGKTAARCRIRNVTKSGALIESSSKVPVGTTLFVSRGTLGVAGEVKWSRESFFGMQFSAPIVVRDWLEEPFSSQPLNASACTENRSEKKDLPTHFFDAPDLDDDTIGRRLAEELLYVSRIVNEVGLILVKDPVLRLRHASSLQQLDIGKQMLSEIAQLVHLTDKVSGISQVATGPMRGRLLRVKTL